jgi:hypothetical protein
MKWKERLESFWTKYAADIGLICWEVNMDEVNKRFPVMIRCIILKYIL